MPWGSYCNVIWIYRWRKKFLLGWGSGEIFICMITYWQTLGTARFFLTFPHPCLARNAAASLALQHLGTTGSPSCSWFLGVPTFLQQVTAVLKRELLSAWNLIYSSRGKKNKIKNLELTTVPKENGQQNSFCADIFNSSWDLPSACIIK